MKIRSFRIKNYRSIRDSGVCYLSGDNVTILAGKNEAGKTSILEALEDFNVDKEIRSDAKPLHIPEAIPELAITFNLDKGTMEAISNEVGFRVSEADEMEVEVIKNPPNTYLLSQENNYLLKFLKDQFSENKKKVENIYRKINDIISLVPETGLSLPEINFDKIEDFKRKFQEFISLLLPHRNLIDERIASSGINPEFSSLLQELPAAIDEVENYQLVESKFIDAVKRRVPNFILFSSFDDKFPSEIPLEKAETNEFVKDLSIISDLNLDIVKSGKSYDKQAHKEQINVRLKRDYKEFWTQDLANLNIDWDSDKLYFFIKGEDNQYYPPTMRSKGRQWHLAFYIKVTARSQEVGSNVILIDEPGLYLHATAQEDILRKLEHSAKDSPIIYSTHSPYLIQLDKLSRIRLISNDEAKRDGTVTSNKIHKGADQEALTPIITRIGLDLSKGLDITKDNNIIAEGITDYYYLTAFKKLLKFEFTKDVHIIPCVGADKFNILVSLMIAWGLRYCAVLDNDIKGKGVKESLLENFRGTDIDNRILFVSEKKDEELEDLFEREDFAKYILDEDVATLPSDKRNSQIIKQKNGKYRKYDSVLLSKKFFEKIQKDKVELSEITTRNFTELLEKIDKSLFRQDKVNPEEREVGWPEGA